MSDADLIRRWSPVLRYDSAESFFADSAAGFAENRGVGADARGNVLRRGRSRDTIAAARPAPGQALLSLDFLAPVEYADGVEVRRSDVLDATADAERHVADALALHADPRYRNRIYGRLAEGGGRRWLQYWFFMYHNDPYGLLNISVHEGDWEMVQLRLGADDLPDAATFAQHSWSSTQRWDDVELTPVGALGDPVPVVYVARGSHASYPRPGRSWKTFFDVADGRGEQVRPEVEVIGDEAPPWLLWPGRWGSSDSSPRGPQEQGKWSEPERFHEDGLGWWRAGLEAPAPPRPLPAAPIVSEAVRVPDGDVERVRVVCRVPPGEAPAARLVVAVAAADGGPAHPQVLAAPRRLRELMHPAALEPNRRYEVRAYAVTDEGVMGPMTVVEARPGESDRSVRIIAPDLDGSGETADRAFQLDARPDVADFRDLGFVPTLAEVATEIPLDRHLDLGVEVRDQGEDGPCTGFALAAVVDAQMSARGDTVAPASARMLYLMARRNDPWEGEDYAGSSARGAMKGWHKSGVCSRDLWPDSDLGDELNADRAADAADRPLGAYFRVNKRDLVAMHTALVEVGVLFATARVHTGWTVVGADGRILPPELGDDASILGGHAFAIVGYDRQGFWIQNSWGDAWGRGGHAHVTYDDWLENAMDAWVARLGAPVALGSSRAGRERLVVARSNRYTHDDLRAHVISVGNDGRPRSGGALGNTAADIARIIGGDLKAATETWDARRVLLYAHGGLVDEEAALGWVARNRASLINQRIYPLVFVWHTDARATLSNAIEDLARAHRAGGLFDRAKDYLRDRLDDLVEPAARAAGVKTLWDEIKENGLGASVAGGAARVAAEALADLARRQGPPLELHLGAHSAGSIFLAPTVALLDELGAAVAARRWQRPRVTSCSLWAPACTMDLFRDSYLPAIEEGVLDRLAVFVLDDETERRDTVGPAYHKSVLYLVSNALERRLRRPGERNGVPLLGMQVFAEREALFDRADARLVVAPGPLSHAGSHVAFDDDRPTRRTTTEFILGSW